MNRLRKAVEQNHGQTLLGAALYFYDPVFLEIAAHLGFQVIWIEMEHASITFAEAADLCRMAAGTGMLTMIRVPDSCRENMLKAAECGPDIIDVPMVNQPAQMEEMLKYARFARRPARILRRLPRRGLWGRQPRQRDAAGSQPGTLPAGPDRDGASDAEPRPTRCRTRRRSSSSAPRTLPPVSVFPARPDTRPSARQPPASSRPPAPTTNASLPPAARPTSSSGSISASTSSSAPTTLPPSSAAPALPWTRPGHCFFRRAERLHSRPHSERGLLIWLNPSVARRQSRSSLRRPKYLSIDFRGNEHTMSPLLDLAAAERLASAKRVARFCDKSPGRRNVLRGLFVSAAALINSPANPLWGLFSGSSALAAEPKFDVVSIRPSRPGGGERIQFGPGSDGYHAPSQTMWATIMVAFYPLPNQYWGTNSLVLLNGQVSITT